jgi:16S rRNA (adenine1518-N6/adenine1519-N6)-dimethyltransferase
MTRPRKRFGQHFLDPAWVDRVVEAIRPSADDTMAEIGPGRGALTLALASKVRHLVAVEIDRDLAPALAARVPCNVEVVEADVLEIPASLMLGPELPARVVGNLPYNISTPILARLLDLAGNGKLISDATVMLQREVADRLSARAGTRQWGVLSACQQLRARVECLLTLPPGAFRPAPKVHSAVVRLVYHPPDPAVASVQVFEAVVRSIFTKRRKMLSNALEAYASSRGLGVGEVLDRAGLDGHRRPETLEKGELGRLADVFCSA